MALEYDSTEFHRDLLRVHSDRSRAADLAVDGWVLLSVTAAWTAADVVARLRRALRRRGLH